MKKMTANQGPNMTPMVDVVMCILIFYMLGSSIIQPEQFLKHQPAISKVGLGQEISNLKLPEVRQLIKVERVNVTPEHPEGTATRVTVFDQAIFVMNAIDDPNQEDNRKIAAFMEEKKQKISDDVQVAIRPDGRVPYQDIATIYEYCVKARFPHVAFYPAAN